MSDSITGFAELTKQLSSMGQALGSRTLRSAALSAMLPAQKAARAAAPVGAPPYGPYPLSRTTSLDPYPKKTYKGRLVTPGFTSRSVIRRAKLSTDKATARVALGVKAEAFYALQFIELGTSTIPKRPWLEPSFRASIPAVNDALRAKLKARIDKAAKT